MGSRALINNERALDFVEELVRENETKISAYLRRRLPSSNDAADAYQEVFLRMCQVDHPSRINNPRAFLFRTAHNIVQDYYRKRWVTELPLDVLSVESNLQLSSPSPERILYANQWWAAYCVAIEELTPRCGRVFVMCRIQNCSHAEIAQELGVSIKMVEKYMTKALVHLTSRLEEFLLDDYH